MTTERVEIDQAVNAAWAVTQVAGFVYPMRVVPSTQPGYRDAFDLVEGDGCRVAIVGHRPDAELLAALLNRETFDRLPQRMASS